MEAEAEFLMLEVPGRMLTGVSGGSGAPWSLLCQASGLQNSERFLLPEMASLWYITAATSGSQQILLMTAGASVTLRR